MMKVSEVQKDLSPVSIESIPLITKYLSLTHYEESNHNVVNMVEWMHYYPLFYRYTENYLLLFGIHEEELFLFMPLCKEEYFLEALKQAEETFKHYNQPFVLHFYSEEAKDKVLAYYPSWEVIELSENRDYIYEAESLRTFSGKKLQKKRNHLNAFYKENEGKYSYESMSEENIPECLAYLETWGKEEQDTFYQEEKKGARRVLELFNILPYKGGVIRINGEVKAFAIGSFLSTRMVQENIEKADSSIRGLYQAILQQFLLHEFPTVEFINREDDLGHQNMKDAKMSYHPIYLKEKYRLCKGE